VSDVILREARKRQADLIVMGGYGYPPLLEMLLGSTVDAVLRRFKDPRPDLVNDLERQMARMVVSSLNGASPLNAERSDSSISRTFEAGTPIAFCSTFFRRSSPYI